MRNFVFAIVFSLSVSVASASVTSVKAVLTTVPNTPAGFTVNDILIDFEGQLHGQQMVVQLTSGSIYRHPASTDTAPNSAVFDHFPALASTTFVTLGSPFRDEAEPIIVVGGSTVFAGINGPKQMDETGINIAWAPGAGVVIDGGNDYMVARLTLSNDAAGHIFYSVYAGTENTVFPAGSFTNGKLVSPEPTTAMLTFGSLFALLNVRRRRRA